MIYIKYTLTCIVFIICFSLALNTYRLFMFINKHTFLIVYKNLKNNLKTHQVKLLTNLDFNHRITFKEILNSDHKYLFYLITPPALAIFIRSVYSEFHQFDYGLFMMFTFLLLIIGIYLYFFYRHFKQLEALKLKISSEIFIKSTKNILNEDESKQFIQLIEKDCSNFLKAERVFKLEY